MVDAGALLRWTTELVERLGAPSDIANDVAEVLVASDLRGTPLARLAVPPSGGNRSGRGLGAATLGLVAWK